MKLSDVTVLMLLKKRWPAPLVARDIVHRTNLSFSAVRSSLNRLYGDGFLSRDLAIGLNGHAIYEWSWSGKELSS